MDVDIVQFTMIIRQATRQDLSHLEGIENAADQLFTDTFAPSHWEPAPSIDERMEHGGTILVAVPSSASDPVLDSASGSGSESDLGMEPVGFVHVIYPCEGVAHVEALAVRPECGRRGYGRALVAAAVRLAREGKDVGKVRAGWVTLRTYAGLPWNEGFYLRCGFGRVVVGGEGKRLEEGNESDLREALGKGMNPREGLGELGELANGKKGLERELNKDDEKELGEEADKVSGNESRLLESELGDLWNVQGFKDFMERCGKVEEGLGLMKYGERIVMARRID